MAQKVVLKVATMNDEKTQKKAMAAVAKIYGVTSVQANLKEQKITVIGEMDPIAVAKNLRKIGDADIVTVSNA